MPPSSAASCCGAPRSWWRTPSATTEAKTRTSTESTRMTTRACTRPSLPQWLLWRCAQTAWASEAAVKRARAVGPAQDGVQDDRQLGARQGLGEFSRAQVHELLEVDHGR